MNVAALARRDLRGGIGGLWLLLACLTIAVAGLASVTSLASSIRSALAENSRGLLGGDLLLSTAQRSATAEELSAMRRLGAVAESVTTRANVVAPGGSALVELSGVGPGWPLAGRVELDAGRMPGSGEVALGRELADRFGLRPGTAVQVGFAQFRVSGVIRSLPAVSGFALAPPALVSPEGLRATGLIQPGSLYTSGYRLLLLPDADGVAVGKAFQARFPDGGWRATDKGDAAGGTRRFVDNVGQLLLLIALGALGIGGIGVASAIAAFAASRRSSIAVLKILGARRRDLAFMLGIAVAALAGAAILLGLAIGALTPAIVGRATADLLPIQPDPSPQWGALGLSAVFGLLITLAAAWRPLARAVNERPATVLRGDVAEADGRPGWRSLLVPVAAVVAAAGLALATAASRELTLYAFATAAVLTGLFALLGWLVKRAARLAGGRGGPVTRLGIAALHRPGSATVRLSIALGLGLSLLVALSAIGSSLSHELRGTVPQKAPALFMLDIPATEEARFRALAARELPGSELRLVPSLRGPVTAVNGQSVSAMRAIPEGAWILRGDRGLTFAAELPPGNRVVAGEWWPATYRGPPLVSLDVEAGKALNLKVGDRITVAVLGRPIEARIASFREIDWRSFGFNFAIIFAPGTLESAPYTLMATVAPGAGRSTAGFERALAAELPMVSSIRVAEVVERIQTILDAMDAAIRLATGLAILIGVAVLAGAVAATRASRARESVLLKLVGATRRQVLAAQLIEFGLMSGAIALVALLLGTAAGWAVVGPWFKLPFRPDWGSLIGLPLAGIAVAVAVALLTAWPALRARPAEALRSL
ncbi:FtsX-like permease family protein [Sphingomonas sp. BN140010]|uniref:FtsX-like permease family protein n=1 Tax=Sphingomonas arvum TaxID=2992113 RepID=A0ABT3JBE4_9SPHN|nr:FtsX-like permease family protein [Sphingomonas sp. BN140010]MCW3796264.1 FtsX-like permease family protein [Sphingomonas sp. BN140010]